MKKRASKSKPVRRVYSRRVRRASPTHAFASPTAPSGLASANVVFPSLANVSLFSGLSPTPTRQQLIIETVRDATSLVARLTDLVAELALADLVKREITGP